MHGWDLISIYIQREKISEVISFFCCCFDTFKLNLYISVVFFRYEMLVETRYWDLPRKLSSVVLFNAAIVLYIFIDVYNM